MNLPVPVLVELEPACCQPAGHSHDCKNGIVYARGVRTAGHGTLSPSVTRCCNVVYAIQLCEAVKRSLHEAKAASVDAATLRQSAEDARIEALLGTLRAGFASDEEFADARATWEAVLAWKPNGANEQHLTPPVA